MTMTAHHWGNFARRPQQGQVSGREGLATDLPARVVPAPTGVCRSPGTGTQSTNAGAPSRFGPPQHSGESPRSLRDRLPSRRGYPEHLRVACPRPSCPTVKPCSSSVASVRGDAPESGAGASVSPTDHRFGTCPIGGAATAPRILPRRRHPPRWPPRPPWRHAEDEAVAGAGLRTDGQCAP